MPRNARTDEKFFGYIRLVDACARPGCPVCRYVGDESRGYLDALIYEHVTDPDTRRRLRDSWGFCNWHSWMLLEIGSAASGAAIIYEDLIGKWIHRVRRLLDRPVAVRRSRWPRFLFGRRRFATLADLYRRRRTCPACASAAGAETRSLQTLLHFIADPEMESAYARSDGICARHAVRAVEVGAGSEELRRLLDRTLSKWAAVQADLERFVRKHDYRNREPFTEAEATSYMRAFELLSGAKGVFGNDIHGPSASPAKAARVEPGRSDGAGEAGKVVPPCARTRSRPGTTGSSA
jgi:hypothetical protein